MAREIYIKNTRLLKRALKIEEILAKKESWHYGYADEHGRMTFSELQLEDKTLLHTFTKKDLRELFIRIILTTFV